jgi:hypothetical protein
MKKIIGIFLILLLLNSVQATVSLSTKTKEKIRFYGYTTENCYVIAVSSLRPIHVEEFDFEIYSEEINIPTRGNHFYGLFLTNGSYISAGFGGIYGGGKEGKLQYFHFEFGKINFTIDNRFIFDNYPGGACYYTETEPHTLPAGTWYFIFAQGFFDLPQEEKKGYISVWINLSDYEGVSFATVEGGKIYALCYDEFNAKIIIDKTHTFHALIGGNVKFHINNTFVYTFFSFPTGQGFWRIKWIKPDGIETLNMLIIHGYHIPDVFSGTCEHGIGGSGNYTLITSTICYWPPLNRFLWHLLGPKLMNPLIASGLYFIGLDVKLP